MTKLNMSLTTWEMKLDKSLNCALTTEHLKQCGPRLVWTTEMNIAHIYRSRAEKEILGICLGALFSGAANTGLTGLTGPVRLLFPALPLQPAAWGGREGLPAQELFHHLFLTIPLEMYPHCASPGTESCPRSDQGGLSGLQWFLNQILHLVVSRSWLVIRDT